MPIITPPPADTPIATGTGSKTLVYLPATWFLSEVVPSFSLEKALTELGFDLHPEVRTSPVMEEFAELVPVLLPADWEYVPRAHHGIYDKRNHLVAMNIYPRNPDLTSEGGTTKHPFTIKPTGITFYPYMLRPPLPG